jgi:hypothetical protein
VITPGVFRCRLKRTVTITAFEPGDSGLADCCRRLRTTADNLKFQLPIVDTTDLPLLARGIRKGNGDHMRRRVWASDPFAGCHSTIVRKRLALDSIALGHLNDRGAAG